MTNKAVFVIAATGVVTNHYDKVQAKAHAGTQVPEGLVIATSADLPANGSKELSLVHWLLFPKQEASGVVITRTELYDLLNEKFASQPFVEPTATKDLPANLPPVEPKGTKTMSEAQVAAAEPKAAAAKNSSKAKTPSKTSAKKTAAAPKAAKPRGKGKMPGKAADFKPVLKGSKRANILELMTGKYDATGIGEKLGIPASLVSSNIFCLHRDCAIGYEYGKGGEINALYPAGKSLNDALKVATVKAAKPKAAKTAAKKPAPKKKAAVAA